MAFALFSRRNERRPAALAPMPAQQPDVTVEALAGWLAHVRDELGRQQAEANAADPRSEAWMARASEADPAESEGERP